MSRPSYYVARNKDNTLSLFGNKPVRDDEAWREQYCDFIEDIDPVFFPEMRWEDPPLRCCLYPTGDIYA